MTKYDLAYKKNPYLRGLKPNNLTIEILKYKKNVEVLDFGCGEGQDAVFLSKNGFKVLAIDNSVEAIKNLNKLAKNNHVSIRTELIAFEDYKFIKRYDVILSEASLHFLSQKKRKTIISSMQRHTTKNGINVIGVFDSKTSPKEKQDLKKWGIKFFSKNELLNYYSKWKILFYEQFIESRENQEFRGITQIIAQKK